MCFQKTNSIVSNPIIYVVEKFYWCELLHECNDKLLELQTNDSQMHS